MKAALLGGTGVIGSAVGGQLKDRGWSVVRVGRTSGDRQCDTSSRDQLDQLFGDLGPIDALVVTIGGSIKGQIDQLDPRLYTDVLADKVLRQIRILQAALPVIRAGGQ